MRAAFSMSNAKRSISKRNVATTVAYAVLKCHQFSTKMERSNVKVIMSFFHSLCDFKTANSCIDRCRKNRFFFVFKNAIFSLVFPSVPKRFLATQESREPERYIDPAMIGILAGMALMFIIICVVLRLFSR